MMVPTVSTALLALTVFTSTVSATVYQGFNYGSTFSDGRVKAQSDFEDEFKTAARLVGTNGAFTSARLYTMIQGSSTNDPISAIPAAIATDTSLLLGLWASAGQTGFDDELEALRKAATQYAGQGLKLAGISVGSEDLYRDSPTGRVNGEFAGTGPDELVAYIHAVREAVRGTEFENAPIGHVDTWTAWVNASNANVVEAVDWIGVDAYAYFEDTKENLAINGADLFTQAIEATEAAAQGKAIYVTETGWPVSGKTFGQAIANHDNARQFWQDVGCNLLFGHMNVWWYTLLDSQPRKPDPSFGVISELTETPLFDLSCAAGNHSNVPTDNDQDGSGDGYGNGNGNEAPAASSYAPSQYIYLSYGANSSLTYSSPTAVSPTDTGPTTTLVAGAPPGVRVGLSTASTAVALVLAAVVVAGLVG